MSLNFPAIPDFQFENSPLVEVVCQVRFPAILRITKEEPSAFQELIRQQFPLLQREQGIVIRAPQLGREALPDIEPQPTIYRFRTADEQATISLAADFYAVSATLYTHWENFVQYLALTDQAVNQIYAPVYATRVGLRYINRLTLANTNSKTAADLFTMLRPELTPQPQSEVWAEPTEVRSRLQFEDNGTKFTIGVRYGQEQQTPFLLLDFDYFEEGRIPLENIVKRCTGYNSLIYRAFCWSVRENKLTVFKPITKEGTSA